MSRRSWPSSRPPLAIYSAAVRGLDGDVRLDVLAMDQDRPLGLPGRPGHADLLERWERPLPKAPTSGTALAWCVGILIVAYLFAMVTYRRRIS
jgi:hypothetical protein